MSIIRNTGENVHAKPLSDNTNANKSLTAQSAVASIPQNGASTSRLLPPRCNPAQDLKEATSFRLLLESNGHKLRVSGTSIKCRCPFHHENTPSFVIYDDISGHCFGCGWHGDIFKYEMDYHHVDFKTALHRLQGKCVRIQRGTPLNLELIKKDVEEGLTPEQQKIIVQANDRLKNDEWLIERIATSRGWMPDTIRGLANESSLGWHRGALGFIYSSGLKIREWPGRDFVWEFGHGGLWHDNNLDTAQSVFITEGETDAISLIDCGTEQTPSVVVVGAPSASTFNPEWAPRFNGKVVTIAYDNDKAGEDGLQRVASILRPYAAELNTIDLGEVK